MGFAASKVIASASDAFHVIMAGRSLEKVNNAKSELEASGLKGHLSAVQLEVTNEQSIKQAVEFVEQKFGGQLDVLINNAAVGNRDPDIKTRMQLSMDTNVIGPAVVAAAFRPLLLKSRNPYSIYVSSGAGSLTRACDSGRKNPARLPYGEAYTVSKAALNMLAIQESIEYSSAGLKVFAMCPGFVISNLRGTSEEERNGWGMGAGDPEVSGRTLLSIIKGERDADVGRFVHKDGVYPW